MNMSLNLTNNDHVQGRKDAPIELIEYADYQCSYCKKAYHIIKAAQDKLGDNLKFVFRNFPLQELHPNAVHAAIAAEVLADYGKFWEMHDILFENQANLSDRDLLKYAEEIALEPAEFEKEFSNPKYFNKVKTDFNSGVKNGVEGTPTFFINGKKYEGNWMEPEFITHLESLL